ncbi:hypothetical protein [Brevundimonas sp.]
MRPASEILIDTLRGHARATEAYFAARRDGADEFTLRRIQRALEDSVASAIAVADSADALAAATPHLAALRLHSVDQPDPPPSAA